MPATRLLCVPGYDLASFETYRLGFFQDLQPLIVLGIAKQCLRHPDPPELEGVLYADEPGLGGVDAGAHGQGSGERHLIRWHDHGCLDGRWRGRGEGVHVGRGTIHRAGEALGDDVCHAETVCVASGLLCQAEVDHALHRRAARGGGRRVASRDVGIGAVARDVLPDLIYHENVDLIERQPREVALRFFEERRFSFLQLPGGNRNYLAWLFFCVLDGGEAEGDLAALDGDAGRLRNGLVDVLPARRVDGVRPPLLAEPDGEHLRRSALYCSPERGVGLDPVDHDDRVGRVRVTVHVDCYARGCLPDSHALHRRPHGTPDLLLVNAEVREHLRLTLRGRGAVAPHRGDDERIGARLLQGLDQRRDYLPYPGHPPAPDAYGHRARW